MVVVDIDSSDRTPDILRRMADEDDRITVVTLSAGTTHDPAMAANAGLDRAVGDYVGFVDVADVCEPRMLERLHAAASQHKADLVICKYLIFDQLSGELREPRDTSTWSHLHRPFYRLDRGTRQRLLSLTRGPHRTLYRRQALDSAGVRFSSVGVYATDVFHWSSVLAASSVCVVPEVLCYHREPPTPAGSDEVDDGRLLSIVDAQRALQEWVDGHGLSKQFTPSVLAWAISRLMEAARRAPTGRRRAVFSTSADLVATYRPADVDTVLSTVHTTPYARAFTETLRFGDYAAFVRVLDGRPLATKSAKLRYHLRYSDVPTTARLIRTWARQQLSMRRTQTSAGGDRPPAASNEDLLFSMVVLDAKMQRLSREINDLRRTSGRAEP